LSWREPWTIGNISEVRDVSPKLLVKLLTYTESPHHLAKIAKEQALGEIEGQSICKERLRQLDQIKARGASRIVEGGIEDSAPGV